MNKLLAILLLMAGLIGHAQRPNLKLGFSATTQLQNFGNDRFLQPGLQSSLHVTKRSLLAGLNVGYHASIQLNSIGTPPTIHFINTDVVFGFLILRKPAFKMGVNLICSYSIALNRSEQLAPSSLFYRNNLACLPEVYFSYKAFRLAYNYSLPLLGSPTQGFGLSIGVIF